MYITRGVVVGMYVCTREHTRAHTHTRACVCCLLTIFGERDDFQHFTVTRKYLQKQKSHNKLVRSLNIPTRAQYAL